MDGSGNGTCHALVEHDEIDMCAIGRSAGCTGKERIGCVVRRDEFSDSQVVHLESSGGVLSASDQAGRRWTGEKGFKIITAICAWPQVQNLVWTHDPCALILLSCGEKVANY